MSAPSTASSKPATAASNKDRYSSAFPLYEAADLVVRSTEGILLATEKFYLQAISPVFADTIKIGSSSTGEKRDARPVLQLTESQEDVELLLRLAQRDRYIVDGQALELPFVSLRRASEWADKYDLAPVLQDYLFGQLLPSFLPRREDTDVQQRERDAPLMSILALACIHRREHVIRGALKAMSFRGLGDVGTKVFTHNDTSDPVRLSNDWRYFDVSDLEEGLTQRLPLTDLLQLVHLHNKVLTRTDYSFLKAADDWKVSSALRTFIPTSSDLTPTSRVLADVRSQAYHRGLTALPIS